jgi:AraC-like DNA-binding protein/catechol 2,3-dioxygenase-like lactoylglutathione lyase family enzyme
MATVNPDLLVHLRRARDHADRHYTEPLDLDALASIAGLSKFHFQRVFKETYGTSPAAHLSRRRIERAQDLLRATNLTVTEVCLAVGFQSLGSFSSRFRDIVGETPSAFQARFAAADAPHIPGCFLFMHGVVTSATEEKPTGADRSQPRPMITNISIMSVFVKDIDASQRFYVDILGFEEKDDVTLGDYRWCTVVHPNQPELNVHLTTPGPPASEDMIRAINQALDAGVMNGFGLNVDDCRKTFEELSAKGVTFLQEPSDRPHGTEAVCRDNSGNWIVLVEPREFTPADVDR